MDRKILKNVICGIFLSSTVSVYVNTQAAVPDEDPTTWDKRLVKTTYRRMIFAEEAFQHLPRDILENANARRGKHPHDPALIEAIENLDEPTLKTFTQQGLDINGLDSAGETLLLGSACSFPSSDSEFETTEKTLELLLNNGADPNVPNVYGITPLYATLCLQQLRIARWLLDHGADPNRQRGRGLLHAAIDKGFFEFVPLLLEYNIDVNACNEQDQTPLDIALEKRAAISDDDPEYQTKREELDRIIALLREHNAIESHPRDKTEDPQEKSENEDESEGSES
ncbi:MAG: ankyrin repeat domain-containing protein [Holosporaceae bacterium]|jgi:hypothetical protein|nr:ankyrin repeat domain-containing protein [Holosporaceae bacterium]